MELTLLSRGIFAFAADVRQIRFTFLLERAAPIIAGATRCRYGSGRSFAAKLVRPPATACCGPPSLASTGLRGTGGLRSPDAC